MPWSVTSHESQPPAVIVKYESLFTAPDCDAPDAGGLAIFGIVEILALGRLQRLFSTSHAEFGARPALFQTGAAAYSCGARYGGSETLIAPPFIIRLFKEEARTDEAGAFEVSRSPDEIMVSAFRLSRNQD